MPKQTKKLRNKQTKKQTKRKRNDLLYAAAACTELLFMLLKYLPKISYRENTMVKSAASSLARNLQKYSEVSTVHGMSYVFSR